MNSRELNKIIARLEAGLAELCELMKTEKRNKKWHDEGKETMSPAEFLDIPGLFMGGKAPANRWEELTLEEQQRLTEFANMLREGRDPRMQNDKVYALAVRSAAAEEDLEDAMAQLSLALESFANSSQRDLMAAGRIILAATAVYQAVALLQEIEEKKEEVIYN